MNVLINLANYRIYNGGKKYPLLVALLLSLVWMQFQFSVTLYDFLFNFLYVFSILIKINKSYRMRLHKHISVYYLMKLYWIKRG